MAQKKPTSSRTIKIVDDSQALNKTHTQIDILTDDIGYLLKSLENGAILFGGVGWGVGGGGYTYTRGVCVCVGGGGGVEREFCIVRSVCD